MLRPQVIYTILPALMFIIIAMYKIFFVCVPIYEDPYVIKHYEVF